MIAASHELFVADTRLGAIGIELEQAKAMRTSLWAELTRRPSLRAAERAEAVNRQIGRLWSEISELRTRAT
jgi:hypothetical protein